MLVLNNLTAGYGCSQVLHGLSMSIEAGEVVCVLGPNGAGKSTVLKAIAGLADVHSGTMRFCGTDITRLRTHELLRSGIAFVPQGRIQFPRLTVQENLEMGGYLLGNRVELQHRINWILELFPVLTSKLRGKAASLSGGEGQMLAIGRALVMRPKLLLLDEPSLGLSPIAAREMFSSLRQLVVDQGLTLMIVEQNVRFALEVSDRGYLLAGGRRCFAGTAEELGEPGRMDALYLGGSENP